GRIVQRRGSARGGIRHRRSSPGRQLSSGLLPHRARQHGAQYRPCHQAVRAALRERAARGGGGVEGAVRSTTDRTLMIRNKQISGAAAPARQVATQTSGDETASSPRKPSVVVVMGVSGCGKSTIASMLAHRLNWIYEDGDWFHPQSNVRKMHAGEPLTDEDRWPWLHGIAAWIDASRRVGNHGTVACSALKRAYRDILV